MKGLEFNRHKILRTLIEMKTRPSDLIPCNFVIKILKCWFFKKKTIIHSIYKQQLNCYRLRGFGKSLFKMFSRNFLGSKPKISRNFYFLLFWQNKSLKTQILTIWMMRNAIILLSGSLNFSRFDWSILIYPGLFVSFK